jgi:prevent-host-death family protein
MDRRIDAHIARTQFGQIMDLAVKNNERFIVDRRGEPAVVIMSVQDFIRTAAPPRPIGCAMPGPAPSGAGWTR